MNILPKTTARTGFTLSGLALALLLLTPAIAFAEAAETVVVNFSSDYGPMIYRASGFLHGISGSKPPALLLDPLKPKILRFGCCNWDHASYVRAKSSGAEVQLVVSDVFGYSRVPNATTWQRFIADQVRHAKKTNQAVQWDIWNEPNLSQFWPGTQSQFFEIWRLAVEQIRSQEPNAVIVGPSISGFDPAYLRDFLSYAKANNVLPDVLSWHDFDAPNAIPVHVQSMRSWLSSKTIQISRFSINEFTNSGDYTLPGLSIHYLANLERAGIESAVRACWPDGSGSNCSNSSLDGILTFDASQPRSVWWAYKGYADITGRLVSVTAGATVDGIAGQNPAAKTARVVLGRNGGSGDVLVKFINIAAAASYLNNGGTVHVIAERIADSGLNALGAPAPMINADYAISNNEFTVLLTHFGGTDAYTVTLTPGTAGAQRKPESGVP